MLQIFFMKFIREIFFPINTKNYDVKYYKILDDAGFFLWSRSYKREDIDG